MIVTRRYTKNGSYQGLDPRPALDPEEFFQSNYRKARASATGLGKLVIEFIPYSLMRSFAFAIDPMKRFRGVPVKITPVNRTRYREITSVLESRSWKLKRYRLSYQSYIWSSIGGPPGLFCYSPPIMRPESGLTTVSSGNFTVVKQTPVLFKVKDTTVKTRPPDSGFGEFESFKYRIRSPTKKQYWNRSSRFTLSMNCNNQISWSDDYFYTEDTGPGGVLTKAQLEALQIAEKAELESVMSRDVTKMLARVVPESRRYSAFRNVAELKDLPRSVISLRNTLFHWRQQFGQMPNGMRRDLRRYLNHTSKDIPSEYVGFHFGWKQMYNDVMDLLTKPERAAREINRLLQRSGKPTTFRTIRKIPGKTDGSPAFSDYTTYSAESITMDTVHRRQHELRLVVNATFDFPKADIPLFKKQLFLQKMGVNPTFTDLYNLVPWTWLVDWFTGLGNYVECIDIINTDRSLFNWGLMTGITQGQVVTTRTWKDRDIRDGEVDHIPFSAVTLRKSTHESVCDYTLQLRKNITTAYDVKTILEPSSLSLYQQSILGAILMGRRR